MDAKTVNFFRFFCRLFKLRTISKKVKQRKNVKSLTHFVFIHRWMKKRLTKKCWLYISMEIGFHPKSFCHRSSSEHISEKLENSHCERSNRNCFSVGHFNQLANNWRCLGGSKRSCDLTSIFTHTCDCKNRFRWETRENRGQFHGQNEEKREETAKLNVFVLIYSSL